MSHRFTSGELPGDDCTVATVLSAVSVVVTMSPGLRTVLDVPLERPEEPERDASSAAAAVMLERSGTLIPKRVAKDVASFRRSRGATLTEEPGGAGTPKTSRSRRPTGKALKEAKNRSKKSKATPEIERRREIECRGEIEHSGGREPRGEVERSGESERRDPIEGATRPGDGWIDRA